MLRSLWRETGRFVTRVRKKAELYSPHVSDLTVLRWSPRLQSTKPKSIGAGYSELRSRREEMKKISRHSLIVPHGHLRQ